MKIEIQLQIYPGIVAILEKERRRLHALERKLTYYMYVYEEDVCGLEREAYEEAVKAYGAESPTAARALAELEKMKKRVPRIMRFRAEHMDWLKKRAAAVEETMDEIDRFLDAFKNGGKIEFYPAR